MALKRTHIGIFGATNSGKSTLMNLLTAQEFSIVDPTPGTTSDARVTVAQFHGLGPVKLFDTAGIDEGGRLGVKRRLKALGVLRECDGLILVADPFRSKETGYPEGRILRESGGREALLIFNRFSRRDSEADFAAAVREFLMAVPEAASLPSITADVSVKIEMRKVADALCTSIRPAGERKTLLPSVSAGGTVLLVVPMDEETPKARLLRPQSQVLEELLRGYCPVVCYRPDLEAGRSSDRAVAKGEENKYATLLKHLSNGPFPLQLVVTDTQAMDLVGPWTPAGMPLTTFSVIMINQGLDGGIGPLIAGARSIANLGPGSRILIAEACNHDRQAEDIGTVQIPALLKVRLGSEIVVDHSFGREFPYEAIETYDLVIHCGGCMIEPQKLAARVSKTIAGGTKVTNYGLALTWLRDPGMLERVTGPFSPVSSCSGSRR